MRFFEKTEIEWDIREIKKLLSAGTLENPNVPVGDKNADFTWLMINLRDLIAKAEKFAEKVNFPDDVIPMWLGTKAEVSDVAGLIVCFRDAMVHKDSFRALVGSKMMITLGTQTFGNFVAIRTPEFESPQCDYEDDLMFTCGPQRIYYKRHIVRAFEEAREKLTAVLARLGRLNTATGEYEIPD